MANRILCTCVWCLQESDGQGKSVSRATHTRHLTKQQRTWPNPADLPVLQRCFNTLQTSPLVTVAPPPPPPTLHNSIILSNHQDNEIGILEDDREEQIERLEKEERKDNNKNDQIGEGDTVESTDFGKNMIHLTL